MKIDLGANIKPTGLSHKPGVGACVALARKTHLYDITINNYWFAPSLLHVMSEVIVATLLDKCKHVTLRCTKNTIERYS